MKPIIMVILMSAGIMYLFLHTTGTIRKNGFTNPDKTGGDSLTTKKIFSKETGMHEMLINQLLW